MHLFVLKGYMNQMSGMNRGPGSSYNNMNYNQQTTAAIAKELLDTGMFSLPQKNWEHSILLYG